MNKNKLLTVLVVILLLSVIARLIVTVRNNSNTNPDTNNTTANEDKIVDMSFVNEISITTDSKYATVSGTYPEFRNADPSFNDKIRNAITIAKSEFENNTKDNWKARIETATKEDKINEYPNPGDFYFNIKTDYVQVNKNKISILVTISGFNGGAHGYTVLTSYNYDVNQAKEITLADIFGADYLKKVSEYSKSNLKTELISKINNDSGASSEDIKNQIDNLTSMLDSGTNETDENFSVFTILPDSINIYFQEYQVAPYVYGPQTVKMPIK